MSTLTRIFHPIGQGTFYSETHQVENESLTIVYDCGTISKKKDTSWFEKYVSNSLDTNTVIDLLFISHLDEDHINGITYLDKNYIIKNIVMPLWERKEIIYYITKNNLFNSKIVSTLVSDNKNRELRNSPRIIKVRKLDITQESNNESSFSIDDIEASSELESIIIDSGTILKSNKIPDWCYIPFNYEETIRSSQFLTELQKKIKIIPANIDFSFFQKHQKTLKEIYKLRNCLNLPEIFYIRIKNLFSS